MLDRDRETAEETLMLNLYFYSTLAAPGATELERYYRATRYLSTDIFAKKYLIIPINQQYKHFFQPFLRVPDIFSKSSLVSGHLEQSRFSNWQWQ